MAPVLELDRQTASFVRQLEEQRKLEKTLLVERVRGTKEGLESVFSDIKSRVAALSDERLSVWMKLKALTGVWRRGGD